MVGGPCPRRWWGRAERSGARPHHRWRAATTTGFGKKRETRPDEICLPAVLGSGLRVDQLRMQIVVDFGLDLQGYSEHFNELVIAQRNCPICRAAGSLIGNGSYARHPPDATRRHELRVKRRYCKACHGTISFLPNFLLCFRWYLLVVIQGVVVAHFEQQWNWRQVTAECALAGAPSARTMRRWCSSFAAQAPAWLAAVQATLAEQDPAAPLLDPLGSAAGAAGGGVASAGLG